MQERKVTLALQFIKESGMDHSEMYRKVEELAIRARDWYVKDETTLRFNDEQFAQMMFLDGCFVLQFLYCLYHHPENLKMASHKVALVARDLFLLENQLPFEVLDTLMKFRFKERGEGMELFKAFFKHIRAEESHAERRYQTFYAQQRTDFLRCQVFKTQETANILRSLLIFSNFFTSRLLAAEKPHTLLLIIKKAGTGMILGRPSLADIILPRSLGMLESTSSRARRLFSPMSNTDQQCLLEDYIPPLSIDDSTKSLFLNLVAYEACQGTPSGWITSYVCFMDSLIDHPEDVKELRSKGILLSTLGSDQQVAEFFNDIANYLVPNPPAYICKNRTF